MTGNAERLPPGVHPRPASLRNGRVDCRGLNDRQIALLNAVADNFRQAQGSVVAVGLTDGTEVWAGVLTPQTPEDAPQPGEG